MIYYDLKILHILCAGLLLTGFVYCYRLWIGLKEPSTKTLNVQRIQSITWQIILPIAIIQLVTGFTIISIKHEDLTQFWISGSVIGFIIVISSWLGFTYFLLASQQAGSNYSLLRKAQSLCLLICSSALLSMIFFMANKIVANHG